MKHGSLFSGIGGFDLAAEWMGWENVFHCENNEFCQKILKHYWPNAKSYGDITKTDFSEWRGKVDIVSGGFPCQPYSTAGKRKGKEDHRHLWPEMLRAIREIQPGWVVGENVPGLLNWRGGMVLAEIKADLESSGFEVFPPCILPACGKNAPHKRDRLWIIAHSINGGYKAGRKPKEEKNGVQGVIRQTMDSWEFNRASVPQTTPNSNDNGHRNRLDKNKCEEKENKGHENKRERVWDDIKGTAYEGNAANSNFCGSQRSKNEKKGEYAINGNTWDFFPTQPPVCGGNDGIPDRIHRIKALGNAVVPQVVFEIFKAIETCDRRI